MRKSIPIGDDGSITIPADLAGEVFGKAREAVVHLRSGCLIVSPVYVDLESGTLPQTLQRYFGPTSLQAIFDKHFERGMSENVQFEGDVEVLTLPDVFLFLSASKKSGALFLETQDRWGFFFSDGNLIYASNDNPRSGLAAYLLKRQFLTEQDLVEGLKLLDNETPSLVALQDVSGLTRGEFLEQRMRSVEEVIYQVFTLQKGRFRFQNGILKDPYRLELPMTTTNYVMEATRRLDEWSRIQDRVPPPEAILEVAEDVTASTKLTFEEEQILGLITGIRNLEDILAGAKVGEIEGKKAVASLLAAGMIRVQKAPAPPPPPDTANKLPPEERESLESRIETYNNVFSSIFQALSMEIGNKVEVVLGAFFKGLEARDSLLAGLELDEGGMLPTETILTKLASVPENRTQALVSELNELLYFQLFAVKNSLGSEMERGIVEMAKTLLQE